MTDESLSCFVALLDEFYNDATNNDRKQDIERTLAALSSQDNAWEGCLQLMNYTTNSYALMFSLSVLENVITKKWLVLRVADKFQITSFLYQYSIDRFSDFPAFIRNKLLKINADIARNDWPHFYPNYMSNIITLIQNSDLKSVVIGLSYLQTTSEELICPREDISISRKDELQSLFYAHLPQIVPVLIDVLNRARVSPDGKDVIIAALKAVNHIFSWLSLNADFIRELLVPVCEFSTNPDIVGELSLAIINEMLSKNCVPPSFLPYLVNLACHTKHLFLVVMSDSDNYKNFSEHLFETTRLIITNHWHRLEANESFPVFEFLRHLYQMSQKMKAIAKMIESWYALVDYLHGKSLAHIGRYEEFLLFLAKEFFEYVFENAKLEYLDSNNPLGEYSDDETDEASITGSDWDEDCVSTVENEEIKFTFTELIAKITDLLPSKMVKMVLEFWEPAAVAYSQLLTKSMGEATVVLLSSDSPTHSLHVLEATTMIISSMYYNLQPEQRSVILQMLLSLAEQATQTRLHDRVRHPLDRKFAISLHYQIMFTIKTWLRLNKGDEGIEQSLSVSVPLIINDREQWQIQKGGLIVLLGVTYLPRSSSFLPLMASLFNDPLVSLSRENWALKQLSLVKCILFWNWDANDSDSRQMLLTQVINHRRPDDVDNLTYLVWLLKRCRPDRKATKKMLCTALQPALVECIHEFQSVMKNDPVRISMILKFFVESFKSFQEFMGKDFTSQAVHTFISSFQSINLNESSQGFEELLKFLTVIIESPSASYKTFVPHCLELCLNHICPHIDVISSPQIESALFNLFRSILTHRWNYFYSGSFLGSESALEHEAQFKQIMMAFEKTFTQTDDFTVVSQNLKTLEMLNQKWKLYQKEFIRSEFLSKFLTVLLNNLIEKSHALLSEDIITAIFNMAAVDFSVFFINFIPFFLSNTVGIDLHQRESLQNNLKKETDLPSFCQNLLRLANDVRCYRVCNGL